MKEKHDLSEKLNVAIKALDSIAHPILHLKTEAEKDGCRLDGYMALQVVANKEFYISIATKALEMIQQLPLKTIINKSKITSDKCCNCGAEKSIQWDKHSIGINDKQGSYRDLTFDFCEECGDITNVDFS